MMGLPRRLLRILTLHCDEASALASQAMDEPLDLPERLALGGHRLVCAPCRRFARQLRLLRLAQRASRPAPDPQGDALSPETKVRLTAVFRDALDNRDLGE
jgi:hypothetical protein